MSGKLHKTKKEEASRSAANSTSQLKKTDSKSQIHDLRPEAVVQRSIAKSADPREKRKKQRDVVKRIKAFKKTSETDEPEKPVERKKTNNKAWKKMQGKVMGSKARIRAEMEAAGVDEDLRDETMDSNFRKRLTGGDWEDTNSYEIVQEDGKMVRKAIETDEVDEKGKKIKAKSKFQLSDAERAGLKQYKGLTEMSEAYQNHAREHLKKFTKTHSFISELAYGNITGQWKAWGGDSNFVTPLSEGEAIYNKGLAEEGIGTIEKILGIPEGGWSNKGKTSTIYRFIVHDPMKFNIRLPSGAESGAYQNEWLMGGKTLGGGVEAVIDKMTLEDLKASVASGAIEIIKVTFNGPGEAVNEKIAAL